MNEEKLKSILGQIKEAFSKLYRERLVMLILFGSQARCDAEFGSDTDILVILKGPVDSYEEIKRTGAVVTDLSLQFDEVISCIFIDEETYRYKNGPLLRNIRKEQIDFWKWQKNL